jgi:hypothetical protein
MSGHSGERGTGKSDLHIIAAKVTGSRHEKNGQPCQDDFAIAVHSDIGVIAVADGLSSAAYAQEAAMIAVREATRDIFSMHPVTDESEVQERVREIFHHAREAVISQAVSDGRSPANYASTLIIGVYFSGKIIVGHIGDGIVVGVTGGNAQVISPPEPAEYANETACLIQPDWEKHLRISPSYVVDEVLLATDGCQGALAIREKGEHQAYSPFILPLTSYIRKKISDGKDPTEDVRSLLDSQRMKDLSGDDKTLVILLGPLSFSQIS